MTNVVAYYQTRLHQFSECLTNFSPLIGKFFSIDQIIKHSPYLVDAAIWTGRQQIDCRVDEYREYVLLFSNIGEHLSRLSVVAASSNQNTALHVSLHVHYIKTVRFDCFASSCCSRTCSMFKKLKIKEVLDKPRPTLLFFSYSSFLYWTT